MKLHVEHIKYIEHGVEPHIFLSCQRSLYGVVADIGVLSQVIVGETQSSSFVVYSLDDDSIIGGHVLLWNVSLDCLRKKGHSESVIPHDIMMIPPFCHLTVSGIEKIAPHHIILDTFVVSGEEIKRATLITPLH